MPQDRASRVGRGIAELWQGDANSAVTDLSTVIDVPANADSITAWAHRARGLAYVSLGQNDSAVADYQAYLTLSPRASDRHQIESWIAASS
jgi:Tfp pilus assembly protein PilF